MGWGSPKKTIRVSFAASITQCRQSAPEIFYEPKEQSAEQSLDSKGERPQEDVLKAPKKRGVKEKIKHRRSAKPSSATSGNKPSRHSRTG
jgi:hypothetical protein